MVYANTNLALQLQTNVVQAIVNVNSAANYRSHHLVVDSNMTDAQALAQNPANPAPANIIAAQRVLTVRYFGFDHQLHQGQIVVAHTVADDVQAFFREALREHFPIAHAIPASAPQYQWSDNAMMADNNSSGFNYRTIAGQTTLSNHALGLAFDVNTFLNPYIYVNDSGQTISEPAGATYNPSMPGTLSDSNPLVKFMKARGWTWGGDWTLTGDGVTDYQHFEKPSAGI